MSNLTIENEALSASFSLFGAELQSLIKKQDNEELIWQADAHYWPRHAPVLFPIVGKLKDNTYHFNGANYQMNQHGFARDSFFKVETHSKNSICFLLVENNVTLRQFPFRFEFRVQYILENKILTQHFSVKNTDSKIMYCSFGGHPAFNANPISSYRIKFIPKKTNQKCYWLKDGSICTKAEPFIMDSLELNETIFNNDALIFEETSNMSLTLFKHDVPILEVATCDMPYLGIWSKPEAPFVCIEPWQGWADLDTHNGELSLKSGAITIEPGQTCNRKFEIRVY